MALGILSLFAIGSTIISIVGILALYLLKENRKGILYFLTIWGVILAGIKATSLPSNYISSQIIAWGIGALSIIGVLLYMTAKSEKQLTVSYALVTISVVANLINLFFM